MPKTKTEGIVVSLDGFATLAADSSVASGVTFTSADTISAWLTNSIIEADHGADLNFDNHLSDQPINQIYITSKTEATYSLHNKTLTDTTKAILPLENPGSLTALKTRLEKGTKLHINKTQNRCWNATQTGSSSSNVGVQQQIDNTPPDINRLITYSAGCPRAASPANEISEPLHSGYLLNRESITASIRTPNREGSWHFIGGNSEATSRRIDEAAHNVDLDADGVASTSNKYYIMILPLSSTAGMAIQTGFAQGELLDNRIQRVVLLYHPGTETGDALKTKYAGATFYINKEPAHRCWAVATN